MSREEIHSVIACEVCGSAGWAGTEVCVHAVDVSSGFGEQAGRVIYTVYHCAGNRGCREEAERKASEFAAKWNIAPE